MLPLCTNFSLLNDGTAGTGRHRITRLHDHEQAANVVFLRLTAPRVAEVLNLFMSCALSAGVLVGQHHSPSSERPLELLSS